MRVELVTVGDELLRGDTINTNAAYLGSQLLERGIAISRVTVVPDLVDAIVEVVAAARARADAVIVTGGLGPTHDDRTMAAIAAVFDVDLVEHPAARRWVIEQTEYEPASLAPGTLELPDGSEFLPNDAGLAPGAAIGNVYVLPGVPDEMKAMFTQIADRFEGGPLHRTSTEVDQPESAIAGILSEVERRFDVLVGSYPGGTVTVKIQGSNRAEVERATEYLQDQVEVA